MTISPESGILTESNYDSIRNGGIGISTITLIEGKEGRWWEGGKE